MTKIDDTFWRERWRAGSTGWHQSEVEPRLTAHFPRLVPTTVFVPLCGKSLDMTWLASQGHKVVGVELTEPGCEQFFQEQGLKPEKTREGAFTVYRAGSYTIYNGDFFKLEPAQLAGVRAVYDRAALIALPPELRRRYATRLTELLPPGAEMLLITIDYDQDKVEGPPFSVPESEVRAFYGSAFELKKLEREPVTDMGPKFDGLQVCENAFLLKRH